MNKIKAVIIKMIELFALIINLFFIFEIYNLQLFFIFKAFIFNYKVDSIFVKKNKIRKIKK